MTLHNFAVHQLIPQEFPFVMVDTLLEVNSKRFISEFKILPDNIFMEGQVLREFALIENIAQTASAGLAILNSAKLPLPAEGFLGAISKLTLYTLPLAHSTVITTVTKLAQMGNMYMFQGECRSNKQLLMECRLKLVGSHETK